MRRVPIHVWLLLWSLTALSGAAQSGGSPAATPAKMPPQWPGLQEAVETGDLDRVKAYNATAPQLFANAGARHWLLVRAAREGWPEVVQWLLKKGADPIELRNGETALGATLDWDRRTRAERNQRFPDIARWMAQAIAVMKKHGTTTPPAGALPVPSFPRESIRGFFTPLPTELVERKTRVLELLLPNLPAGQAPPVIPGVESLLPEAARNGFGAGVIERLVAHGGRVNSAPGQPLALTALHAAAASGNLPAAGALLARGADADALFLDPLASQRGMNFASGGVTPMMQAILFEQEAMVRFLLEHGVKPDTANRVQARALHAAAGVGHSGIVRLLLDHQARVDALDRSRCTPLHLAAAKGQLEVVKFLLDAGAGLEGIDEAGFTPLLNAIEGDHLETVQYLLARGASVRARTDMGKGPLRVAATCNSLRTAKFFLDRQEPVEGDTPGINSPLFEAASSGHPRMVALLLDRGASPESRDRMMKATTLMWAVLSQPATAAQLLPGNNPKRNFTLAQARVPIYHEIIRLLVANHADLEAADRLRNTALHHAAQYGDRDTVALLLSLGARRDPVNLRNETARDLALAKGHAEIAALLEPSAPPL